MLKRSLITISLILATAGFCIAQNKNSSQQDSNTSIASTRTRTVAPKPSPTPAKQSTKPAGTETAPAAGPQTQRPKATPTPAIKSTAPSTSVLAAFDKIIEGIQQANVDMVTSGYWNSASLILFNYNGSVTKGWAQMRKNRETSYPDIKDVKLDVHDKHVVMLGRDGAVVSCLWTQSQMFKGTPDTASGRMTLVFKRVGTEWKAVHLHTSPDKPDPSRVPPSEQTPSVKPTP
jgi:ketosteroid isomerase-like protein